MRNFWLVAKREYLEKVRNKAFIISTLLMPVFLLAVTVLPSLLMMHKQSAKTRLVVVTQDAKLGEAIKAQIENNSGAGKKGDSKKPDQPGGFDVQLSTDLTPAYREVLDQKINSSTFDGVLWISAEDQAARKASYLTKNISDFALTATLDSAVSRAMTKMQIESSGISPEKAEELLKPFGLTPVHIAKGGKESDSNQFAAFFLPFIMLMVLYMTLIIYGAMVMRSVIEEKSSRVMEVLLSSLRPSELMGGKLIGVGAVGLTQMLFWGLLSSVASLPGVVAAQPYLKNLSLPLSALVLFLVYFVLGYFLYSAMFAAVGAMCNTQEDAQQFVLPVMLPLIACVVFAGNVIQHPESQISFWLSIFPLTSPVIMFTRVAVQMPPLWQIALSLVLLVVTVWGLVLLCGRIYRVGILMYGKRPTLPEIIRWIRQS